MGKKESNMTTIAWVRHGMTDWNKLHKIQGQTDIPLNRDGLDQARKVAERFEHEGETWDLLISSDLSRAVQTAETIGLKLGIPVTRTDIRLRERSYGKLEGMTIEQRRAAYGDAWPEAEAGIEPEESVIARGTEFVRELLGPYTHGRIIVVSHGSYIRRLLKHLLNEEVPQLGNTSVTKLRFQDERWHADLMNCAKHLD